MYPELFFAALLHLIGHAVFGHFEAYSSVTRKLSKIAFNLGLTALIALTLGRPWSFIIPLAFMVLGLSVHFWWTRKHGINFWTAEPREKYFALRGWKIVAGA